MANQIFRFEKVDKDSKTILSDLQVFDPGITAVEARGDSLLVLTTTQSWDSVQMQQIASYVPYTMAPTDELAQAEIQAQDA